MLYVCTIRKTLTFCLAAMMALPAMAEFKTAAKQVFLYNPDTKTVLFEKNSNELMSPSSMTKIMTSYLIFGRLKTGEIDKDDTFPVSTLAWKKRGSRMFVEVNSHVSVDDLLHGVVTQSGNDAAIVLAEGVSGNEEVYAVEMTRKARALGATNTTFKNATGWYDPLHLTTARDLSVIATRIMHDFPALYNQYFGQKEFTYNKISQQNRNPLLYGDYASYTSGLKTGYTDKGGYGLVASVYKDNQHLILVVNGLKSKGARAREANRIIHWGFTQFKTQPLFKANREITKANVWLGDKPSVSLVSDKDLVLTLSRKDMKKMKLEVVYDNPVPVDNIGKIVGKLMVSIPDRTPIEYPLRAVGDAGHTNFVRRISAAFEYLIWGHNVVKA